MQQFHSLRSFEGDDAELSEEGMLDVAMLPPTKGTHAVRTVQTNPPVFISTEYSRAVQMRQTDSYNPVVLQHGQTTQSLVLALRSTMQPSATSTSIRTPIVIPGDRKRQRNTQVLIQPHEKAGLNPHLRHALAMLAALCILTFSMFSLTPLGSGQSGLPIFDGAVKWAQTQQLDWNILLGQAAQVAQQNKPVQAPVVNNPPVTTTTTDTLLPQSQYIAIAQAAATQYGISPVLFVRQINQESGFNPYAVSPGGAVGIAQFEPATAAGMGVNPYDPQDALYGAARMMSNLAAQYGGDYAKALAGYNAGSGAVDNAVAAGGAAWLSYLPAETQNYVSIIMG
jgi:hypothetical protein